MRKITHFNLHAKGNWIITQSSIRYHILLFPWHSCLIQHKMKSAHLISSHSIFCFLLVTQHAAIGLLYSTLFRSCCGNRIYHFLMASSSLHIPTASKHFESIKELMQSPWKCCITLILQKGSWRTERCSFLERSKSHIQKAYSTNFSLNF